MALAAPPALPTVAAGKSLVAVRVEGDSSIGRSYAKKAETVKGLGAQRKQLRTATWHDAYGVGSKVAPTLESYTLAKCHMSKASREDVLAYFRNSWDLTTTLFSGLVNDSCFYAFPDKLRRPLIFYSAHPAALYVNKMHQAGLLDHVNPYFQKLFETGVDEMSWDDMDVMQDEDFPWPDVAEVVEFRARVKEAVEAVIMRMPHPHETPVTMDSPYWALWLAFEHDHIHLETSSVLIHQLPIDSVSAPPGWRVAPTFVSKPEEAPANALLTVVEGVTVLGKPRDFPSFGWDNEYGQREVRVPTFQASKFTVTNAEFLPFVLAGGYTQRQWWVASNGDDEGWRWLTFRNATHPSFWVASAHPDMARYIGGRPGNPYQKDDGHVRAGTGTQFKLRIIFDIIDMPWDWPVEVNYLEACAFLRWKAAVDGCGVSYRMPTEAEYHMLRGDPVPFPAATVGSAASAVAGRLGLDASVPAGTSDGKVLLSDPTATTEEEARAHSMDASGKVDIAMQPSAPGNVNWRWHSSTPVNMYAPSSAGAYDMHGNVWQWAEDHFAPLPGFEIHYLYDDFSSPCFDGWHTSIMGGSWVSKGDLASNFARYHFRRHFFQHLGFRYVKLDACSPPEPYPGAATVTNLWEGMSAVSKDVTNAYAKPVDRLPFPNALVAPDAAMAFASTLAKSVVTAYTSHAAASAGGLASTRVLHLGCGVGGVSFELVRAGFGHVVGVDSREAFIRHARVFKHHGQFEYERVREGVLTDKLLVKVPAAADRARADFHIADPCALPAELLAGGGFDVLVVDDLLCTLTQPLDLTKAIHAYVRPGGVCIIASNNNWQPSVTPRNSWLGGFKMNGEDMPTLHILKYNLKRAFDFKEVSDLARLTRCHERHYELDVLEVSVWRRREEA